MKRPSKKVRPYKSKESTRARKFRSLGPKQDHMVPPWIGCVRWALTTEDFRKAFTRDTGRAMNLSHTEVLTDRDFKLLMEFTQWVNRNLWGEIDGHASDGEEDDTCLLKTSK